MTESAESLVDRGREIVTLTFELARRTQRHFRARAAESGLTPNEARALLELTVDEPKPISALGTTLQVDPPNVTRLVGTLTSRGLVSRSSFPADARVRTVALTATGAELHRNLQARITEANPVLAGLTVDEQRTLQGLLRRLVRDGSAAATSANDASGSAEPDGPEGGPG